MKSEPGSAPVSETPAPPVTVLSHTGDSSNISWYSEIAADVRGRVMAEVLCAALEKRDGKWRARSRPVYYFKVYRNGVGLIAEFNYQPSRPRQERLPDRTVTKLVREVLA